MKSTTQMSTIAMTLFAVALPFSATAQDRGAQNHSPHHDHCEVVDLGTFGGPSSGSSGQQHILTARGAVAGGADHTEVTRRRK